MKSVFIISNEGRETIGVADSLETAERAAIEYIRALDAQVTAPMSLLPLDQFSVDLAYQIEYKFNDSKVDFIEILYIDEAPFFTSDSTFPNEIMEIPEYLKRQAI